MSRGQAGGRKSVAGRTRRKARAGALMRISDLVERTGVRRETIHFYLREGLLPRPAKAGRNMAYYDEEHVERLNLIKRLQSEKYLPLDVIRRILRGGRPRGGAQDLEVLSSLFALLSSNAGEIPIARRELKRRTGFSDAELERIEAAGLISGAPGPEGQPSYSAEDARAASLLRAAEREAGYDLELALESFTLYRRHLAELARDEAQLFAVWLVRSEHPLALLEAMRRGREVQWQYLAHLRASLLRRELEQYVAQIERSVDESGGPAIFSPSAVLLERRGSAAALADLETRAAAGGDALEACAAALFSVGAFDRLAQVLAQTDELERPRLLTYSGAARVEKGNLEEGLALLRRACEAAPDLGIARALHGAALVRLGRRTIARAAAGSALREVSAGLLELGAATPLLARSGPATPPDGATAVLERLRALLTRGRVYVSLPRFFGVWERGLAELLAVVAGTKEARADGAGILEVALDVLEMNAEYFAAMALASDGRPGEARSRFQRAAAVDPDGSIAARVAARLPAAGGSQGERR